MGSPQGRSQGLEFVQEGSVLGDSCFGEVGSRPRGKVSMYKTNQVDSNRYMVRQKCQNAP